MSKPSTFVDKDLFLASIAKAEANGPLVNFNAMAQAVADVYNAMKVQKKITHSIVLLRIKEWKITVKIVIGGRRVVGLVRNFLPEHSCC